MKHGKDDWKMGSPSMAGDLIAERDRLRNKLAAEREKVKETETLWANEVEQLREQLAAEREKVQKMCQVAYDWMLNGEPISKLPNELQCIADTQP